MQMNTKESLSVLALAFLGAHLSVAVCGKGCSVLPGPDTGSKVAFGALAALVVAIVVSKWCPLPLAVSLVVVAVYALYTCNFIPYYLRQPNAAQ